MTVTVWEKRGSVTPNGWKMISVSAYDSSKKTEWDAFIDGSKNGTFMLKRDYVEYHSDRFTDFSVMFYDDGKLIAVMPASLHGEEVRSHGGLTYGGVISDKKMTTEKMLNVFDALRLYLKEKSVKSLLYKRVPSIYALYPSDEDLYALFRNQAVLIRRDISTTIYLPDRIKFSKGKKWGVSRARQAGITVKKSTDYDLFIEKENEVLKERHNAQAVHTSEELAYLAEKFPDNISLFVAELNGEFLAGSLVYVTSTVAHTQYIATTAKGRELFAFDYLGNELINNIYADKTYFDFGISTEHDGQFLNQGLCQQKETFGGRGMIYDFYKLEV